MNTTEEITGLDGENANMVTIISSDGERFEIPRDIIGQSTTLKNALENGESELSFQETGNVSARALKNIIAYMNYQATHKVKIPFPARDDHVSMQKKFDEYITDDWLRNFTNGMTFEERIDTINTASYLDVFEMPLLLGLWFASDIKFEKTPEQAREAYQLARLEKELESQPDPVEPTEPEEEPQAGGVGATMEDDDDEENNDDDEEDDDDDDDEDE